MFDVDRPTAEYRLSRVLTEHLGECRLSALRGVIAAAAREAYASAEVTLDGLDNELARIARALQDVDP